MKRFVFIFILTGFSLICAFAQRVPIVGIMPFESTATGITSADTANITNRVFTELSSWGTINVVNGSEGAEYVIHGTISRSGSSFVITAATVETSSKRILNEYREEASTLNNFPVISFCAKAVDRVPFPNYLLGTWQATINMPDGPVVCIIEFRSDRTILVERYDTWEHKQNNSLRYEGYGRGTYSYAGYANRVININSQQVRIDATVNIILNLEETLPEQTNVNQTGMNVVFSGDKNSFDFVTGSLPCGRNYDGPSIYPSETLAFSRFAKIR